MSDLELVDVTKSYGALPVLNKVNLKIEDGAFTVIIGPSGCGKSTLLRSIAGLETISDGEMRIGGRRVNDLSPSERRIAMVFQSYALYPHMSVFQNMAFGLKFSRQARSAVTRRVQEAAEALELTALLERRPRELSGGQRQRVAIGRAIVREPSVFLFDEPLSNLDTALRANMRIELAKLHRRLKTTMVYVTHDQVEAMTLATHIVVLNGGYVEQTGTARELYHRPANRFVASFIGSPGMNFVTGRLAGATGGQIELRVAGGQTGIPIRLERVSSDTALTVGIRPEHLINDDSPRCFIPAEVELVEWLGETALVHMKLVDNTALIMRVNNDRVYRIGERIRLGVDVKNLHIFDRNGCRISHDI